MNYNSVEIEKVTAVICQKIQTEIKWRYEEKLNVMLSEFSQMTSIHVIEELRSIFPHEWNDKNIDTTPLALFDELAGFNKLTKNQIIFTMPASETEPGFAAIIWPWGHGGTFSLRLKPLKNSYNMDNIRTPSGLKKFLNLLLG